MLLEKLKRRARGMTERRLFIWDTPDNSALSFRQCPPFNHKNDTHFNLTTTH